MNIMWTVALIIAVIVLAKKNLDLSESNHELVRKYQHADKRASILYDANQQMKRVSVRVVKES